MEQLRVYFKDNPLGPETEDEDDASQKELFHVLQEIILATKKVLEFTKDNNIQLVLNLLEWRKKALNFLCEGRFYRDISSLWSERELEYLVALFTNLTLPFNCKKTSKDVPEYVKLLDLMTVYEGYEDRFKQLIGDVNLDAPYVTLDTMRKKSGSHHTRGRKRMRSNDNRAGEGQNLKKVKENDLNKLKKLFDIQLSPLKPRSRFYYELILLKEELQPNKIRYTQLLEQVKKAQEAFEKLKSKFDLKNPLYDWNSQYLRLDSFLAKEIEVALEQFDLERVLFDTSELDKVSSTFKWYQIHKKRLKPHINEKGVIDISSVTNAGYGVVKRMINEGLKAAPYHLQERLKSEKHFLNNFPKTKKRKLLGRTESKLHSKEITKGFNLPFVSDKVEILSLGRISLDNGFHESTCIYPRGFKSIRSYYHHKTPNRKADYVNTIKSGDDGPIFEISNKDSPQYSWVGNSSANALQSLNHDVSKNAENQKYDLNNLLTRGNVFFGLEDAASNVRRMIECQESSELCPGYVFIDEEIGILQNFEPEIESLPFIYRDEELVFLHALKTAVEKESSSKQKLYSLLQVSSDALPDISSKTFARDIFRFISESDGVISRQESLVAHRLGQLSQLYLKVGKHFSDFSNENRSEKQKLLAFQEITRNISSMIELGLRNGPIEVLTDPTILDIEVDDVANLFESLKTSLRSLIECFQDFHDLPLQVQSWIYKWKQEITRHFVKVLFNGELKLSLCQAYFRSQDEHRLFIDNKTGQNILDGFSLYPGGIALESSGKKEKVFYYWPAYETITNKTNCFINFNGFKKDFNDELLEECHGQFDTPDIISKDVVIYLDFGYVFAAIHTYFPADGLYELHYKQQNLYEKVKLFKDGLLETWQNPDEFGKVSAWRFKRSTDRDIYSNQRSARVKEEYDDFSEDDEFVNFQDDVEGDPDFLPTKKTKWEIELENLRDHNIPGPRLEAPNLEAERQRHYVKSINYDSCELFVYARTLFANLHRWSLQKNWFLMWRQNHQKALDARKRVNSKPNFSKDRQKGRSFILQRFKGYLASHKQLNVKLVDLNGMVLKFEQVLFEVACKVKEYDTEIAAYNNNHSAYRAKVRSVLSGLSTNRKLQKQVLTGEILPVALVSMQNDELVSEKLREKRITHAKMMDQDRFLVKPSQAHISKPMAQPPPVTEVKEKTYNDFERVQQNQKLMSIARKQVEEKVEIVEKDKQFSINDIFKKHSIPSGKKKSKLFVITQGEIDYQEANMTSVVYGDIARVLEPRSIWRGTIRFPSADIDSSVISAPCSLRMINLSSTFINSDITKQLQRHFLSIFPDVLYDEDLYQDRSRSIRILETDLGQFKSFVDDTLTSVRDQVVLLTKIRCPLLMKHYEKKWRKDLTLGAFTCVKQYGFEMWIIPPYFNENEMIPKMLQDLPFGVRRSPIALFHLRREPNLHPIHYVISKIPEGSPDMSFDIEDFTFSHDFQGLMERCFDYESNSVSKTTYQERRKLDFEVVETPLMPYLERLDSMLTLNPSDVVVNRVDQEITKGKREDSSSDEESGKRKSSKRSRRKQKKARGNGYKQNKHQRSFR